MEMVKYWKTSEGVAAKITKKDGVIIMQMEGEKYDFPGYPRGHILYGPLSKIKHEVKNQVFNESWALLDEGKDISTHVRDKLNNIYELMEMVQLDLLPPKRMVTPARELHRAWTKASPTTTKLRDVLCLILQEDDAYRFRLQWIVGWMPTWLFRFIDPVQSFCKALEWLETAEVIDDMKERIRLFRRVFRAILKDKKIHAEFTNLFREINWKKMKLSKADKYFFRGKYFKVDLDKFEY